MKQTVRNTLGVKVRTQVRAGGLSPQHNESLARALKARQAAGVKVKTQVRAGFINNQHNETLARAYKAR